MGGTTLCELAHEMGEVVTIPMGHNCLIPPDGCSTMEPRKQVLCEKRLAAQQSFSAIERLVTDGDVSCPEALLGINLRDPIATAKSTMHLNQFSPTDMRQVFDSISTHSKPRAKEHPCLPSWDHYQHFDNFAVRSLSGNYNRPPGMVTKEDLEAAKRRLERFHVVMILDRMSEYAAQLRQVFGWTKLKSLPHKNKHKDHGPNFSAEQEAALRRTNAYEYDLLAFGEAMARNLTRRAEALEAAGRGR